MAACVALSAVLMNSCGPTVPHKDTDTAAEWTLEPQRPTAGRDIAVALRLRDRQGRAVRGARLRFEGHMAHPGMMPVTAAATETEAGLYEARLTLSMAGPWTLVAAGARSDGERLMHTVDVHAASAGDAP